MKIMDLLEQPDKSVEQIIRRDCQPYLNEIGGYDSYILYRGMRVDDDQVDGILKFKMLSNRTPMSTLQQDHDVLNKFFKEKWGHPYRDGIFATPNKLTAKDYGNVYKFYPIGKFSYVWSPFVEDLYTDFIEEATAFVRAYLSPKCRSKLQQVIHKQDEDIKNVVEKTLSGQQDKDGFYAWDFGDIDLFDKDFHRRWVDFFYAMQKIIINCGYKDSDLTSNKRSEVMFWCKEYYLVPTRP